nr:hypothetical protein [Gloeobacter violaceus]
MAVNEVRDKSKFFKTVHQPVDRLPLQHGVLKAAQVGMHLGMGLARRTVEHFVDAGKLAFFPVGAKDDLVAGIGREGGCQAAKLGREIGVQKKNAHRSR